jgi:uncharacterized membrane protein
MNKQISFTILFSIAILLILVEVWPLIPTNVSHYSEIGVLGPNRQLGGYPANVTTTQVVSLYGFIANHEGSVQFYQFLVKLGNQTTQVSNITSASAPIIFSSSEFIDDNQSLTFPINLTLTHSGSNQRLIFELWDYNATQFTYTGLWNQIWVNVT